MPQYERPGGGLLRADSRALGATESPESGEGSAADTTVSAVPEGPSLPYATDATGGAEFVDPAAADLKGHAQDDGGAEVVAVAENPQLRNIGLAGTASDGPSAEQMEGGSAAPARSLLLVTPHEAHPDMLRIADTLRDRGYPVVCIAPEDCEELARTLQEQPVRVVVMHVGLLDSIELDQMVQLRREHESAHWVLAWHSQSPRWVELVVYLQARGCIDCDDPRSFGRAIDSVIAGDLWFPRWLTHALYFTLLTAIRVARIDAAQDLGESGTTLTKREAEALELMRQGLTNKEIARRLLVSVNTVKKHLKNAFDKRGLHSRRQGLC